MLNQKSTSSSSNVLTGVSSDLAIMHIIIISGLVLAEISPLHLLSLSNTGEKTYTFV